MNHCMDIHHDSDIKDKPGASEQAVKAFKLNLGPKPILQPMRIDWDQGRTSKWNKSLFKDFLQYFIRRLEDEKGKNQSINPSVEDIEDMFYTRLVRLRRYRRKAALRDGEETEDSERRLWAEKMGTLKRQRQSTRRRQVNFGKTYGKEHALIVADSYT